MTIQQLLDKNDTTMVGFNRLVEGERIESKVYDFAAESASNEGLYHLFLDQNVVMST